MTTYGETDKAWPLLKKREEKVLERPVIELLLRSTQTEEAIGGKKKKNCCQMLPGLFRESRKERGRAHSRGP